MTALSRLFERRAIDASDFDIAPMPSSSNTTGVTVTPDSALSLIPVYAAVSLIADTISALPVDTHRRQGDVRIETTPPRWLASMPNPEQTWREFVHRLLVSLLLWGNAYAFITDKSDLGFPLELWTVHPDDLRLERRNGRVLYVAQNGETFSRYTRMTPAGEVIHLKGFSTDGVRGLSPIELAAQGIGLGLVMESFGGRFFGSGQNLSGVIESPGPPLTKPEMESLKENWTRFHGGVEKSHLPGVLTGGATWKPIGIPPEAAQFLGSRKFNVTEIARLFRVPPHLIGDVERSTSWGTGIEEQNTAFVQFTLGPWLACLEDGFDSALPRGQYIRWKTAGLLRGDIVRRYQAYATGRMNGFLNADEIRGFEDMNPLPDGIGEEYLVPLNLTADPEGAQTDDDTDTDTGTEEPNAGP